MMLVVIGAAAVALPGCTASSSRRAHERYNDIVGIDKEHRQVDLNTASRSELAGLPGLTDADADRIIANRPYGSKQGLLRKDVIGEGKYERIEGYVFVSQVPAQRRRDREQQ
jgi:radical SAM superfamily enzyme with C-terminal helix-hairpin-helix motif